MELQRVQQTCYKWESCRMRRMVRSQFIPIADLHNCNEWEVISSFQNIAGNTLPFSTLIFSFYTLYLLKRCSIWLNLCVTVQSKQKDYLSVTNRPALGTQLRMMRFIFTSYTDGSKYLTNILQCTKWHFQFEQFKVVGAVKNNLFLQRFHADSSWTDSSTAVPGVG